jgi:hypothetical protein
MCEEHAFEMFKKAWEKADFKPYHIYQSGEDGNYHYILIWEWVEWYRGREGVEAITKVMDSLDEQEEKDGCAYKLIEIGEDNYTDERKNLRGQSEFEDFHVIVTVNLPKENVDFIDVKHF